MIHKERFTGLKRQAPAFGISIQIVLKFLNPSWIPCLMILNDSEGC